MNNRLFSFWSVIFTLTYAAVTSSYKFKTVASTIPHPTSCKEVLERGYITSDVYVIQPENSPEPFLVFCNLESLGGGWTTILNRVDGSQDFYKNWDDYKEGFGNLHGEFWLGLERIHLMTINQVNEVLFELVDWNGTQADAHYDRFGVGSESQGYGLILLGEFSGEAGDGFGTLSGMKFSTADKDQDASSFSCAVDCKGGWWYHHCANSNPTGLYYNDGAIPANTTYPTGIFWEKWHDKWYGLKELRMMIRPIR